MARPEVIPGNDLEGDPGCPAGVGFVPAPGEDGGIPTLQSDDPLSLQGGLDHDLADLVGGHGSPLIVASQANELGTFRGVLHQGGVGQVVVENQVGCLEALDGPDGDEARVAGSGTQRGERFQGSGLEEEVMVIAFNSAPVGALCTMV